MDIQSIPNLDESKRELISLGLNECRKMQNLITNFQAFVQPSSGKKILYNINRIVADTLLLPDPGVLDLMFLVPSRLIPLATPAC